MRCRVAYSLGKGHPNGQTMKTSNRQGAQFYSKGWECSLVSGGGLGHVYLGFWKLLDIWGKILHLSFSLWMSLVFPRQWPLPLWIFPSIPHQALEDSPWSFSHCSACFLFITTLKKYPIQLLSNPNNSTLMAHKNQGLNNHKPSNNTILEGGQAELCILGEGWKIWEPRMAEISRNRKRKWTVASGTLLFSQQPKCTLESTFPSILEAAVNVESYWSLTGEGMAPVDEESSQRCSEVRMGTVWGESPLAGAARQYPRRLCSQFPCSLYYNNR